MEFENELLILLIISLGSKKIKNIGEQYELVGDFCYTKHK